MRFRTKGFTSLLIATAFSIVVLSGVALYVSPKGRVANWTGWTLLGLDKHQWGALHINICLLFLTGAVLHLFFNWRVFMAYIKGRTAGLNLKLEMAVALLITSVVVVGTWLDAPPFTAPVAVSDQLKAYWESSAPQGPAPHAEEFTMVKFAAQLGLDVQEVNEALRTEGYDIKDSTITVADLAEQKGAPPSRVFADLRKHFPEVQASRGPGMGRGMGRGMGMGMGMGMGRGGEQSGRPSNGDSPNDDSHQLPARDLGENDAEDHPEGGRGNGPGRRDGRGPGWGGGPGAGRGRGQGAGQGPSAGLGRGHGQDAGSAEHTDDAPNSGA